MSLAAARRCNITHLIDERFAGIAMGVGQQKIKGRILLGEYASNTYSRGDYLILLSANANRFGICDYFAYCA